MHPIQVKILELSEQQNLTALTLRKIGELIGDPGSPQKIKHHLNKLIEKGLLVRNIDGKTLSRLSGGIDKKTNLISLPLYGSANCGQALELADDRIEGYLKVSKKLLDAKLLSQAKNLFVLKAMGNSMNKAAIRGNSIEDGDYVLVNKTLSLPRTNDYVVSIIDGAANIKKIYRDQENQSIVLLSESTQDYPPIYIHQDDYKEYLIAGRVVGVMKRPEPLRELQRFASKDVLHALGDISSEEHDYYKGL